MMLQIIVILLFYDENVEMSFSTALCSRGSSLLGSHARLGAAEIFQGGSFYVSFIDFKAVHKHVSMI